MTLPSRGAGRGRQSKEGGHGGGHDGAGAMRWLLTYADLITLLMVFFVVLYSISQVDQQKYIALANALRSSLVSSQSGNAVVHTTSHNAIIPDMKPKDADLEALGQKLASAVTEAGETKMVHIELNGQGLVVSFAAEGVFFEKAQAVLRPEFQHLLDRLVPILKTVPNPIDVQGYTDDLPLHSSLYPTAWELSAARATNVTRYLVETGGLDPSRMSATAFGEWRPKYPNTSEENRAKNRRVDLVLLRNDQPVADTVIKTILDTTQQPSGSGH